MNISSCKEGIMYWFEYQLIGTNEFTFANHEIALLHDFIRLTFDRKYSPGTLDRKWRELREDYRLEETGTFTLWSKFKFYLEEKENSNSREKHFIVRRKLKNG